MKKLLTKTLALLALTTITGLAADGPLVTPRTQPATFEINAKGALVKLSRNPDGRNFLASTPPASSSAGSVSRGCSRSNSART